MNNNNASDGEIGSPPNKKAKKRFENYPIKKHLKNY
jgi:hypothetical protein